MIFIVTSLAFCSRQTLARYIKFTCHRVPLFVVPLSFSKLCCTRKGTSPFWQTACSHFRPRTLNGVYACHDLRIHAYRDDDSCHDDRRRAAYAMDAAVVRL